MRSLVLVMVAACWSGGQAPAPQSPPQNRAAAPIARTQPADEHVDDVDDSGETVLHSKRWEFAGYFNRLKRQIASHWEPEHAWKSLPQATRDGYGTATRSTVVRIAITDAGDLQAVTVQQPSGVSELDIEALRSLQAAAPFEAPPAALRPLTISFAFALELTPGSGIPTLTVGPP